jgi:hypothetical protein
MKKLGILDEEGLSPDDQLLHYFSLLQGPLTEDVARPCQPYQTLTW